MKRVIKAFCMALLAVAAVPAAVCVCILWALFRLTDLVLRKTERRNDEN